MNLLLQVEEEFRIDISYMKIQYHLTYQTYDQSLYILKFDYSFIIRSIYHIIIILSCWFCPPPQRWIST